MIGADTRIRTADLLITNQLLYQLSYVGEWVTLQTEEIRPSCQDRSVKRLYFKFANVVKQKL